MKVTRSSDYEEMGSAWQCLQAELLNGLLQTHGVAESETRQRIVNEFLLHLGVLQDQGWFVAEGRRVYPLQCFSTNFLNVDTDPDDLGEVFLPSDMFSFAEYAGGNAMYFFEDKGESLDDLPRGVVGEEER